MSLHKTLAGKLLIGFLLIRLLLVLILIPNPDAGVIVDSPGYIGLAQRIYRDGNMLEPEGEDLYRPIGYPLLLYVFSGFNTPNPISIAFFQLVLTSLTCVLLYWIGSKLGFETAGLVAGWLYALSPHAAFWSLTVMTESSFAFTLALALLIWVYAMKNRGWIWYFLSGVTLGVGALIRPIGIYVVVIWAFFTWFFNKQKIDTRRGWASAGSIAIGLLVIVLPWMLRNYIVRDQFAFSTVTRTTLYGFNLGVVVAEAEGITREGGVLKLQESDNPLADIIAVIREYPVEFIRQETSGVFRTISGVESGVWARLFGYGRERQGGFGVLALIKSGQPGEALARFVALLSDPDTRLHFGLSSYGMLHTLVVYVLAIASIFWGWKQGGDPAWVIALSSITVVYFLVIPGAAGQARFRIPVEPLLTSMAGFGWLYFSALTRRNRSTPTRDEPSAPEQLPGVPS